MGWYIKIAPCCPRNNTLGNCLLLTHRKDFHQSRLLHVTWVDLEVTVGIAGRQAGISREKPVPWQNSQGRKSLLCRTLPSCSGITTHSISMTQTAYRVEIYHVPREPMRCLLLLYPKDVWRFGLATRLPAPPPFPELRESVCV